MYLLLATGTAFAGDELLVWHSYRGEEKDALEQAAAAWSASSGVRVELVDLPFGAFDSKVETAIPRGNGPDLFVANHANLGKWVAMDLLDPWDGDPAPFRTATVDAMRLNGHTWGVPLAFKSVVLLYDPELVQTPPTTTDEPVAQAKALTGDGRHGPADPATEPCF